MATDGACDVLHVIGPARGGMARSAHAWVAALRAAGADARVERVGRDLRSWWHLGASVRRHRPRVLHAHGLTAAFALFAADVRSAVGDRPIVISVHSFPFHRPTGTGGVARLWLAALDRVPRTLELLAVSHAVAAWLYDHLPRRRGRIRVMPPPLAVPPPRGGGSRPTRGDGAGPVIGFVGRLSPEKGLDTLLRACAALRAQHPWHACRLAIVGDGPQSGALRRLSASLGIADACAWLGWRDDAAQLVSAFDLVAVPSRSEGLGLVALEALVAGTPVVAARVGGLPEALGFGRFGVLVDEDDPGAWAAAIARVLADREAWRQRARAGAQRALARHDPARIARRTLDVYARLSPGARTR